MSIPRTAVPVAMLFCATAAYAGGSVGSERFGIGATPNPQELSQFFAISPSGEGLPPGIGTVREGASVYAAHCASCHGDDLRGKTGDALVGGRGTLRSSAPVKTVESYWPYATTIFDYVKRAMPMDAPGSLSNDQIYSVTAFILFKANVVAEDTVIDATTLPKVLMPNRRGFISDTNR